MRIASKFPRMKKPSLPRYLVSDSYLKLCAAERLVVFRRLGTGAGPLGDLHCKHVAWPELGIVLRSRRGTEWSGAYNRR